MAVQRQIQVGLSFTADTTQAKKALVDLKQAIQDSLNSYKITGGPGVEKTVEQITKIKVALEQATDVSGKFNLTKFERELTKSGLKMSDVQGSLNKIGASNAFNQLASQIAQSNSNVSVLQGKVKGFFDQLGRTAVWTIQSNAIHAVEGALRSAYNYAQKLNKGLTDIAIVSDLNTEQLTEFAKTANRMAKELSATTNEYVSGALIYYQQGLSDEEVVERTNTTIKMAHAAGESAEQISSYMTAVWNNFADGTKDLQYYADVIALLGAETAASNADVAEGLEAFAATANTVGLSYEYAASALTALRDVTQQSASTIGNSLKTIFARLSSVKLGDTLEDGVDLTKYSKALQQVGVDVVNANGELRAMDDILDDLAQTWGTLTQAQKIATAQTVGGVRQYNNLISLMDNYDFFQTLVDDAKNSAGYLDVQAKDYADSWEAANNRLRASFETLYSQIINDKFIIKLTNFLSKAVNLVTDIIDGMGGMKGAISTIISAIALLNPDKVVIGLSKIREEITAIFQIISGAQAEKNVALQKDTIASLIGNLPTDNPEIFGMANTAITAWQKYADAMHSGDKAAAELWRTIAERQQAAVESALALDKNIQKITSDEEAYGKMVEKSVDSLKKKELLSNLESTTGTKKKINILREAATDPSFGLSDNVKKQIGYLHGDSNKHDVNKITELISKDIVKDTNVIRENMGAINADAQGVGQATQKTAGEVAQLIQPAMNDIAQALQDGKISTKDINTDSEAWKNFLQTIVKNYTQVKGYQKDIEASAKQMAKEFENASKSQSSQDKDWAKMAMNVARVASSLTAMNSAIDGISSAFSDFNKGAIDAESLLTKLVSGSSSLIFSVVSLTSALKGLGLAGAALGWAVAGLVAAIAAVKIAISLWNKGKNDLKELAQAQDEWTEKAREATSATGELSDAVSALVENYNTLNKKGESVFDTLNDLKEQVPELIEQYKKLAEVLGVDLKEQIENFQIAYEHGLESGNFEDFEKELEYLNALTVAANSATAQNNFSSAQNKLMATGHINAQGERTTTFHSILNTDYKDIIEQSGLNDFIENYGGWRQSSQLKIDTSKIEDYYEALVRTKKALDEAGESNSNFYKEINSEIGKMSEAYGELQNAHTEKIKAVTKDFNTFGFGENSDLIASSTQSMGDFITKGRQELINRLASVYTLTDEDAEKVLRQADFTGAQERLYQRWIKELGNGEADNAIENPLIKQAATYYDNIKNNLGGWYEQFANGLDYSAAVKNGVLDEDNLNTQLSEAVESWRKSQFTTEGQNRGFDTAEMQEYADYLADIADKNDQLADSLQDDSDAALLLARSTMSLNKGVESLNKNWDDWGDVLKKSSKESKEYYDALKETKNAIADMFEVSAEFVDNDFIDKHLDDIGKAATGDEKAIEKLRQALADDIVANIITTNNGKVLEDGSTIVIDTNTVMTAVADMRKWLADNPIEIGTQMNLDKLEAGEEDFLKKCNDIMTSAHMTAEQANAFFDAMGFETTFVTEQKPVTKTGHSTVTSTRIRGYDDVTVIGDGGQPEKVSLPSYETFTYPGTAYQYTDYVDAIAMTTGTDGKTQIPKIESITRKASAPMNNLSSSNKGGNGGSKGGGSQPKARTKEKERYHEINSKIEQNAHALEMLNTAEGRAYGQQKLDLMEEKIKLLEEQAELYKQLGQEAQAYFNADKANLEKYGATFNDDRSIANFDAWYGEWVKKYLNNQISEEQMQQIDDYVKKYEDSLKHLNDAEKKYVDAMNQVYDQKLEKIEYRLKNITDLIKLDMDYLDYMISMLNDDGLDTAEAIAYISKEIANVTDQYQANKEALADIFKNHEGITDEMIQGLYDGSISVEKFIDTVGNFTEKEIESIKSIMSSMYTNGKDLKKYIEDLYAKLGELSDKFQEAIDEQIDKLGHMNNMIEKTRNIIDIMGKDTLGISDDLLNRMQRAQIEIGKEHIATLQQERDQYELWLAQLEAQYAIMDPNSMEARALQEQIDEYRKTLFGLKEEIIDVGATTAEAIKKLYTDMIDQTVTEAGNKIAGVVGDFDKLLDAYEKQKNLDDLYLKTYEKTYQTNKLLKDINKSINDTANIGTQGKLRDLQEEILGYQQEGKNVTEEQMEERRKYYELLLAEAALQEAQNAKNMVRMTRDSEGNWSYTYTADQGAIDKLQQEYDDKLFAYEDFNEKTLRSAQDTYVQLQQEWLDALRNAQTEAEVQAVNAYYEPMMAHTKEQVDYFIQRNNELVRNFDVDANQVSTKLADTVYGVVTGFDDMDTAADTTDKAMKLASSHVVSYLQAMETEQSNLANNLDITEPQINQNLDEIEQGVKDVHDAVAGTEDKPGIAETFDNEFNDALGSLKDFHEKMGPYVQGIMEDIGNINNKLTNLITTYSQLSGVHITPPDFSSTIAALNDVQAAANAAASAVANAGGSVKPPKKTTDDQKAVPTFGPERYDAFFDDAAETIEVYDKILKKTIESNVPYEEWIKIKKKYGLATGGYTGSWGPDGRLAFLHEKELVLNKADTENLLTTVSFVRDLTRMISLNAAEAGNGLGNLFSTGVGQGGGFLDQNVTIHAEFPNATNHSEIEEAFSNLIGLASQYAGRRK